MNKENQKQSNVIEGDYPARRSELSPVKRSLLEKRLRGNATEGADGRRILRRSMKGPAPLSFAQRRLWFLDQLEPGGAMYNIPSALRVKGELKRELLEQALGEVVRRHEILRTRFEVRDGEPVQAIDEASPVEIPEVDMSGLEAREREEEARRIVGEGATRSFELSRGPLLRARVMRLGEGDQIVLLTMHHIVSDGWSMGVLIREISELYEAYGKGEASPLAEPVVQYADYAVWQREWSQGEALEKQLDYWQGQLDGMSVLDLPTDKPRPMVATHRGARAPVRLSAGLTRELNELSRREGVTLFITLLAGFQLLLARYSGQDEIAVGTPIAGRNQAETEGMIGFFVNTLVMRSDFGGDPTVEELLRRVREMALGAYMHQDLPFEELVGKLHPERSLSRQPLFQVMFALQNTPRLVWETGGLRISAEPLETDTAKFDLTLSLVEVEGELQGALTYATDLYERGSVIRLADHLSRVLEGMAGKSGARVMDLPLMREAEWRQVVVRWNQIPADYRLDKRLEKLYEEQAERTPDRVAMVYEEEHQTYQELNRRANRLAHYLRKAGVEAEVRVGLYMERGPEMVESVLGVLKAGGAYMPLDVRIPQERLGHMIEDSSVVVIIKREEKKQGLPERNARIVCLDRDGAEISRESEENPIGDSGIENSAYVIFTSGSTGRPKGVVIEHRQILNYVMGVIERAGLEDGASYAMVQPLSVDSCKTMIYPSLFTGGCLHVISEERVLDPKKLGAYFREKRIDCLKIAPSHLAALEKGGKREEILPKRKLFVGGERMRGELVERLSNQMPGLEIYNSYGPTEATVAMLMHKVKGEELEGGKRDVLIGSPMGGTKAYILDQGLRVAPVGVKGELYIGGSCVARGYLNQEGMTAESFLPDPYGSRAGGRLYKSGDICRWVSNGNIEFIGRRDTQVKVRGYRIELGEVERAIKGYAGVGGVMVEAQEGNEEDLRLVAYVVEEEAGSVGKNKLREYLKQKLPEYMRPSAIVMMDEFPLSRQGKVDRRALPALEPSRRELDEDRLSPRNLVEETLTSIWSEVLRLERVGVNDNFFELGGHSLLATQLVSRIREVFNVELPLKAIFEEHTLASLSRRVGAEQRSGSTLVIPPIERASRGGRLPLSFAQQRLWFIDQLEPGSSVYNMASAMTLEGELKVEALRKAFAEEVRRHEGLRTRFESVGGEAFQVIDEAGEVSLPLVDLSELGEERAEMKARKMAREEAQTPFDLSRGPLLRVRLLRLGEWRHILLLTVHHIISDGWSTRVLVRELSELYGAYSRGEESPLEELGIQCADYAVWQRQWLQGDVLEEGLKYWRERLEGELPVLELPTDKPKPATRTYRGGREKIVIGEELTGDLKRLSRQENLTLFMTLLAAFKALLMKYSGQEDVIVGTPVAGRNRTETEGLIGLFVNTLPLRTKALVGQGFRQMVRRVREVALGAYMRQDIPFEKLVEELKPERSLSHSPLFQVMFNLLNFGDGKVDIHMPGLQVEAITPTEALGSKFDLTLFAVEKDGLIKFDLVYNADIYHNAQMIDMLGHLHNLLREVVSNPDIPLPAISLLTITERRQIQASRSVIKTTGPFIPFQEHDIEQSIADRFEQQVRKYPGNVAVKTKLHELTYKGLNSWANMVAKTLLQTGARSEDRVALLFEHDTPMIVGILGALKTGMAYVPLDLSHPVQRLTYALDDSQAKIILTNDRNSTLARDLVKDGIKIISVDSVGTERQVADIRGERSPDKLAYILYTSVSTGRPKGVAQNNRNVLHFIGAYTNALHINSGDKLTVLAPYGFDAALMDIYSALLNGATLYPYDIRAEGLADLSRLLIEDGITIYHSTPTVYKHFVGVLAGDERFPDLRLVVLGGETVHRTEVELYKERFSSGCVLVNLYGSAECSVALQYFVNKQTEVARDSVPIGYPVEDTEVFLLNSTGRQEATYGTGEIIVRSDYVALGYRRPPELTRTAFLPDREETSNKMLYRTGDIGRLLPDGSIEFTGRKDFQVKIRGYRIELGEIEVHIRAHPGVRQCLVIAPQEDITEKRLVVYLVAVPGQEPTVNELRTYLKARLPEYSAPAEFVWLEGVPLTLNGKVDRHSLPPPKPCRRELEDTFIAPRTPVEGALAGIWGQLLGLEKVGVNEDFFELGGHSLLGIQVISRVREAFGIELPLRSLFEEPTVAGQAREVEKALLGELADSREVDEILTKLDRMTDEEVTALLAGRSKW